jgi:hypothetical protein
MCPASHFSRGPRGSRRLRESRRLRWTREFHEHLWRSAIVNQRGRGRRGLGGVPEGRETPRKSFQQRFRMKSLLEDPAIHHPNQEEHGDTSHRNPYRVIESNNICDHFPTEESEEQTRSDHHRSLTNCDIVGDGLDLFIQKLNEVIHQTPVSRMRSPEILFVQREDRRESF